MGTKEPCIGCPDINLDEYGYLCDLACGKRTAWLNYMEGVKEMATWIKCHLITTQGIPIGYLIIGGELEAKLNRG